MPQQYGEDPYGLGLTSYRPLTPAPVPDQSSKPAQADSSGYEDDPYGLGIKVRHLGVAPVPTYGPPPEPVKQPSILPDWLTVGNAIRYVPPVAAGLLTAESGPGALAAMGVVGAGSSSLANWYEGRDQDPIESGIAGLATMVPVFGEVPGANATARELLNYAIRAPISHAIQGAGLGLTTAETESLLKRGEFASADEAIGAMKAGGLFGGITGGAFASVPALRRIGQIKPPPELPVFLKPGQKIEHLPDFPDPRNPPSGGPPPSSERELLPPFLQPSPEYAPPPSLPPSAPPVAGTPTAAPTPELAGPPIVTIKSPTAEIMNHYRSNGYVTVPGLVSPEGYTQVVRGDLAPLYANAQTRPTEPAVLDTPGLRGEGTGSTFEQKMRAKAEADRAAKAAGILQEGETGVGEGEDIAVPGNQVTKEFKENLAKRGYEAVAMNKGKVIFRKTSEGTAEARIPDLGTVSPATKAILGRIFKPNEPLKTAGMNPFEFTSLVRQIAAETDREKAYQNTLDWHERTMLSHASGDHETAAVHANISDLADMRHHELTTVVDRANDHQTVEDANTPEELNALREHWRDRAFELSYQGPAELDNLRHSIEILQKIDDKSQKFNPVIPPLPNAIDPRMAARFEAGGNRGVFDFRPKLRDPLTALPPGVTDINAMREQQRLADIGNAPNEPVDLNVPPEKMESRRAQTERPARPLHLEIIRRNAKGPFDWNEMRRRFRPQDSLSHEPMLTMKPPKDPVGEALADAQHLGINPADYPSLDQLEWAVTRRTFQELKRTNKNPLQDPNYTSEGAPKYEHMPVPPPEGESVQSRIPGRTEEIIAAFKTLPRAKAASWTDTRFLLPDGTRLTHGFAIHEFAARSLGTSLDEALPAGIIRIPEGFEGADIRSTITSEQAAAISNSLLHTRAKEVWADLLTPDGRTLSKKFTLMDNPEDIQRWVNYHMRGGGDQVVGARIPGANAIDGIIHGNDSIELHPSQETLDKTHDAQVFTYDPDTRIAHWRDKPSREDAKLVQNMMGDMRYPIDAHSFPNPDATLPNIKKYSYFYDPIKSTWQSMVKLFKGRRDSVILDETNTLTNEDLKTLRDNPVYAAAHRYIDEVIHTLIQRSDSSGLKKRILRTGTLINPRLWGMHAGTRNGRAAVLVNLADMLQKFDPATAARKVMTTIYHELAHNDRLGGPIKKIDFSPEALNDPRLGEFLKQHLEEALAHGSLNPAHDQSWIDRMKEFYAQTGPELDEQFRSEFERIFRGDNKSGGYSSRVPEILHIYSKAKGSKGAIANIRAREGFESSVGPGGEESIFSRIKTAGDGTTSDEPSAWERLKGATGWGQGVSKPVNQGNKREFNFIKEALAVPSAATTTADMSFPGRQGISQVLTPEFWKAGAASFKGFSPEGFKQIHDDLANKPIMVRPFDPRTGKIGKSIADKIGKKIFKPASEIGPRAEGIASRWVETGGSIPLFSPLYRHTVGYPIRAANRMYLTFLNHLNINRTQKLFDLARDISLTALKTGRAPMEGVLGGVNLPGIGRIGFSKKYSPQEAIEINPYLNMVRAKEISDMVDTATGHGPLKMHILPFKQTEVNLEKYKGLLGGVLFSPGLISSRMRLLNPSTYIMASPFVRKQYMQAALSTAAAWFTATELAKMAGDKDVQVSNDITSADFGKIRIGNTRLDPGAGFLQFLTAYGRMYKGGYTSSSTGKFHKFGEGFQAQTQEESMQRFFVNKLNPSAKFLYDILDSTQYKPFHVYDRTLQMFIPLATQDMIELAHDNPDLMGLMGPILLGMGQQTYSKGESVGKLIDPKHDWLVKGGGINSLMPWNWK